MHVLGISCYYHDASACIVRDGEIIAAVEEERFTRVKHDASFPVNAIAYCMAAADIGFDSLDHVIFYEKPLLKFERILSSAVDTFPASRKAFVRAMEVWFRDKLWTRETIRSKLRRRGPVWFGEHHLSHAASAFLVSPFQDAAVLTADGVGEWATTSVGVGDGTTLELVKELRFPHSLGLLYSAFTAFLGFEVNEGEYKVMGMAAYGKPRFVDQVRQLIDVHEDGSFQLDMRFFSYHRSLATISSRFIELFGAPRRPEASGLDERYADVAASVQAVLEDVLLKAARHIRAETGSPRLCMAGGVALNGLANTRILKEAGFDEVFIQPAAGDAGGSVGAAAYLAHSVLGSPRVAPMRHAYLGPAFSNEEIAAYLEHAGIAATRLAPAELRERVADLLAADNVVGWFRGRMEFGPRALGARSILASPVRPEMKDVLNEKIKHRESFRPFAPSVPVEDAALWFDIACESPYMLHIAPVRPEKRPAIPAVTHVDGTARLQTVDAAINPEYHALIRAFERRTGIPVVVNTSFNVRGEPIVNTPEDAFECFAATDMDALALGDFLILPDAKRSARGRRVREGRRERHEVIV